ncbi:MAG: SLC13/DASS family transporter [Bacteroidetes bacterium]|nr:MAG: SLC13/DASS family transporter [Bacteroidota bacterium]
MTKGNTYIRFINASLIRKLLFILAPFTSLYLVLFVELDPNNSAVTATLAIAIWIAVWWVTEIIPLGITSLLPVVLFPLLGVMNGKEVSTAYFNHVIFLFIGGFLVALAIQKWNLHKRIALVILEIVGNSPGRLLFGFMFTTSFLSMWISNTATAMLMVPIIISITQKLEILNGKKAVQLFAVGLLLAVAYSASIGGIATLVGTPPNLSFIRIFEIYFPNAPEISFSTWMKFALPISIIMFIVTWTYLYYIFVKKGGSWKSVDRNMLKDELKSLGPMSYEEKAVSVVFITLALLWMFRSSLTIGSFEIPGWANLFNNPSYINDGTVAIAMAILLFIIPSKQKKEGFLMDWKTAEGLPWEIILLFGGGFALATGFKESGLSNWFGEQLVFLDGVSPLLLILIITFLITFLTEITSNTATVETLLPILAGLAISIQVNPLLFMIPATVAGSFAFMLPVATPPNAIIFGTRKVTIFQMAKTGFLLNLFGIIIITLMTYFWGTDILGIELNVFPSWAK